MTLMESWSDSNDKRYDVVIVGSGAGGAIAAHRLAQAGLSICVIERGSAELSDSIDPTHAWADGQPGRAFLHEASVVGGATMIFSGNLLRFHPEDFRKRSHIGEVA